jgi:hypothetical protein
MLSGHNRVADIACIACRHDGKYFSTLVPELALFIAFFAVDRCNNASIHFFSNSTESKIYRWVREFFFLCCKVTRVQGIFEMTTVDEHLRFRGHQRVVTTVEESVLRTEMENFESQ